MNKEKIKKFIKEHKGEIIVGSVIMIGAAALTVIGVKCGLPEQFANCKKEYTDAVEFMNTASECCDGCTVYNRITVEELQAIIDNGIDIANTPLRDPDNRLMIVENIIVFGNEVKP